MSSSYSDDRFVQVHAQPLSPQYLLMRAGRDQGKVIRVHREGSADLGMLTLLIGPQYKELKGSVGQLRK